MPAENLDEERKESIKKSLRKYRETVLDLNMEALKIIIQATEDESTPEDCPEEEADKARIYHLRCEYGIRLEPPDPTVSTVQDLLSEGNRERLISTCSLDGVNHGPVDTDQREQWFADCEDEALNTEGTDPAPEPFPEDLKYLGTLVRGICGPGLPGYREHSQFSFLTAIEDLGDYGDERVVVPLSQEEVDNNEFNALSPAWADWAISVGVRLGDGEIAWNGGYLLYCRHRESEERERGEWRWRYGFKDDAFQGDLYDTVEEFLEWYAYCGKQSEEDDNIEIHPIDMDEIM